MLFVFWPISIGHVFDNSRLVVRELGRNAGKVLSTYAFPLLEIHPCKTSFAIRQSPGRKWSVGRLGTPEKTATAGWRSRMTDFSLPGVVLALLKHVTRSDGCLVAGRRWTPRTNCVVICGILPADANTARTCVCRESCGNVGGTCLRRTPARFQLMTRGHNVSPSFDRSAR